MNPIRFQNFRAALITACLVALPIYPALWLAATNWGQKLEKSLIDLRYVLSGPQKLSSQIVLVLEDGESKKRFGHLESSRGVIAALINQAHAESAKVIAIDFQFLRPNLTYEDSLLLAAVKGGSEIIVGCSYDTIAPPKPREPTALYDTVPEESVEKYPDFLVSPDSMRIMPLLLQAGAKPAFVDVIFDSIIGQANIVPLYLRADKLVAAFGLEAVKSFFGISDSEIKVRDNKLLLPVGYDSLRIPILPTGEFLLNHLGKEDDFDYFSWAEVYDWTTGVCPDTTLNWKGKIVLIGSKLDDPDFPTPYATDFFLPGVMIHATVIDNILTGRFLRPLSANAALWLIIGCGLMLFWLFSRVRPLWQVVSLVTIFCLFASLTFGLFHFFRIVLPFSPVALFIASTAVLQGTKEWLASVRGKANLEMRLHQLEQDIARHIEQQNQRWRQISGFMFFIFSLERSDQSFFPHYLFDPTNEGPFWRKIRPPLGVSNHSINKLQISMQHLHKSYMDYVLEGTRHQPTPLMHLRKIGARLESDEFGLGQTFRELSTAGGATVPLHLVVSNLSVPWYWGYDGKSGRFLNEEFALGISFASERRAHASSAGHEMRQSEHPGGGAAVLFYGDWQGHPEKELKHVRKQIYELERKFDGSACDTAVIHQKSRHFLNRLSKAIAEQNDLRIIHYTGHARNGLLDVGPDEELAPNMLIDTLGMAFTSRPLVFINACSSGKLSENWEKMDHLCTEFLACGAAACVVTSADVYEKTACAFALQFYEFFIKQGKTGGEALKLTIQKLGEPDPKNGYDPEYDITRYFYQLFGDPTVRF